MTASIATGTPVLSSAAPERGQLESVTKYSLPDLRVASGGMEATIQFNRLALDVSSEHGNGLADVVNAIHSPDVTGATIAELRRDIATQVTAAYGWDVDVFYKLRAVDGGFGDDRWRWATPASAASALLDRLAARKRKRFKAANVGTVSGHTLGCTPSCGPCRNGPIFPIFRHTDNDYRQCGDAKYGDLRLPERVQRLACQGRCPATTGVTDGQWNAAIADLILDGLVECQGERGGVRYRIVERGKNGKAKIEG